MQGQKSRKPNFTGGGWFKWKLKILGLFLVLISFSNLIISNNTFALYTPTLSASVNQANLQINGNQVINSVSQTSELPIQVTVNTNNRTGYTATLNTETDETALVNTTSTSGAKINSIDTNKTFTNFSENTWGFLSSTSGNYQPIPSLSNSINLYSTTAKTSGNENFDFKIGMKLSSNLESGSYTNKLVISIISNQYEKRALMTTGINFNTKLKTFETGGNKIEHIMRSATASSFGVNTVSLEDEANSDYEIKAWYDSVTKTAYYYTEAEKIFLNDDSNAMFYNLVNLTSLDVSSFDTSKVRGMGNMFFGDEKLVSLDLSNFNTQSLINMDKMFYGMSNLTNLNISSFDTSNVTNMNALFYGMANIENIDISNFNTRNITNMSYMFSGMHKLKQLQLPATFDTSNVTDMSFMFANDHRLHALNLSHFNTQNVTNMQQMFFGMYALSSIDLSNFDTKKVTLMDGMFNGCVGLTSINVSNFNTENVENMNGMFAFTDSVEELDLSSFRTPKVKTFRAMFFTLNPNRLKKIYVSSDFDTSAAFAYQNTDTLANIDIFHMRNQLVGGNGTTTANTAVEFRNLLKIDRPGVPGLFTRKP